VYDVQKPQTLEWCKAEANKLMSWNVKKIIFAGNKSDADCLIDFDQDNFWFKENDIRNVFLCATNNVGCEDLFIEIDRVDDMNGGSIYTLNCLLGKRSEYARTLLAEEQEIACMQLAWLAFRCEMKYYENKNDENSFWIRSDLNDRLARNIERIHQIDEIEGKIPDLKNMLSF
jgi:hypothetical protein